MRLETDRALIPASASSIRYLTVTVTAPDAPPRADRKERLAVDVAFVLDRSRSMGGRKIEMAREAAAHAIQLLGPRDHFSLVAYDDEVSTVLERTPASPAAKARALALLNTIDARGNTNLDAGWQRGVDLLSAPSAAQPDLLDDARRAARAEDVVRRVLLLSDGLANAGETNADALARRAAEFRARGVATSTFGIGADFDEQLLSRLATAGGGHFYYIEQVSQIPDFLTSELGETLEVVAPDARLIVTPGPGVEVGVLNGFTVEPRPPAVRVYLGDLIAGQEVTVVLAVPVEARLLGSDPAFIDCRLVDQRSALYRGAMRVDWRLASDAENATQPVNTGVLVIGAEQVAARSRLAALAANRQGDYATAVRLLREAAALVREIGRDLPAIVRLARELDDQAAEFGHAMSASAMKREYFQSYNLSMLRDSTGKARRRA